MDGCTDTSVKLKPVIENGPGGYMTRQEGDGYIPYPETPKDKMLLNPGSGTIIGSRPSETI